MTPPPLSNPNAWFTHFDIDQSGQLTSEEIIAALLAAPDFPKAEGVDGIRSLVHAVLPVFDRDGSGTIDRQEFCGPGGMAESLLLAAGNSAPTVDVPHASISGSGSYVPVAMPVVDASAPPAPPVAAGSAGSIVAGSGLWECSRCTFVNRDCPTCKACGGPAPAAASGVAPAPAPVPAAPPAPAVPTHQPYQPQQPQQPYQPQQQNTHQYNIASSSTDVPAPRNQNVTQSKTFRVLIPPGTQPGQQIKVPTGNGNSVLVAVPDRRRWRQEANVGTQPFFDITVKMPNATSAPAAAAAAAPSNYGGHGTSKLPGFHGAHSASIAGAASAAASTLASSILGSGGGNYGAATARPPSYMSQSMPAAMHSAASGAGVGGMSMSMGGNPHLVPICPHHVATHPTTLILKEKSYSFSGDDAKIKDSNGNTLFSIKAELMTMSQRRYAYDSQGQRVAQLRRSRLLPSVYIGTPTNEKRCSIVMSGFLNPLNCNANIMLNERQKIGKISGNWRAKKFKITIDGSVVATVSRKKTMQSVFMGADSYCIDVEAGVDLVFIGMVAIALDELYHDEKGGMGGGGGGSVFDSMIGGGLNF